jgi:hypothetical protein
VCSQADLVTNTLCPHLQVLQSLGDDLCYANLALQQPGTSPGSSWKKASTKPSSTAQASQAEVEYITMVCPLCSCWRLGRDRNAAALPLWMGFLLPAWAQLRRVGARQNCIHFRTCPKLATCRFQKGVRPRSQPWRLRGPTNVVFTLSRRASSKPSGSEFHRDRLPLGKYGEPIVLWLKLTWGEWQREAGGLGSGPQKPDPLL